MGRRALRHAGSAACLKRRRRPATRTKADSSHRTRSRRAWRCCRCWCRPDVADPGELVDPFGVGDVDAAIHPMALPPLEPESSPDMEMRCRHCEGLAVAARAIPTTRV